VKPTTFHPDADAEVTEAAEYYEISDGVISPVLGDESLVQRAVKDAVRKAGIVKRATCLRSGIHLPPMCSKPAMTFAQCRNCSDIRTSEPQ